MCAENTDSRRQVSVPTKLSSRRPRLKRGNPRLFLYIRIYKPAKDVAARVCLSQNRVSHLELHHDELSFKQLLNWCVVVGLELRLGERKDIELGESTEW